MKGRGRLSISRRPAKSKFQLCSNVMRFCKLWIHKLSMSLTLKKHLLHLSKVIGMQGPEEMASGNVTSSKLRMEAWGMCYTGTQSHGIITGQALLQQGWQENSLGRSLWSPSPGDSHQHSLSSSQATLFLIKINSSLML